MKLSVKLTALAVLSLSACGLLSMSRFAPNLNRFAKKTAGASLVSFSLWKCKEANEAPDVTKEIEALQKDNPLMFKFTNYFVKHCGWGNYRRRVLSRDLLIWQKDDTTDSKYYDFDLTHYNQTLKGNEVANEQIFENELLQAIEAVKPQDKQEKYDYFLVNSLLQCKKGLIGSSYECRAHIKKGIIHELEKQQTIEMVKNMDEAINAALKEANDIFMGAKKPQSHKKPNDQTWFNFIK